MAQAAADAERERERIYRDALAAGRLLGAAPRLPQAVQQPQPQPPPPPPLQLVRNGNAAAPPHPAAAAARADYRRPLQASPGFKSRVSPSSTATSAHPHPSYHHQPQQQHHPLQQAASTYHRPSSTTSSTSSLSPPVSVGANYNRSQALGRSLVPRQPPPAHCHAKQTYGDPRSDTGLALDLGSKRRHEMPPEAHSSLPQKLPKSHDISLRPPSLTKSNPGLFKVEEPSVLITSEASKITTVVNTAAVKVEKTESRSCSPTPPPASESDSKKYVHKKKTWLYSYTASGSTSEPAESRPDSGNGSERPLSGATPSPAPSTASSTSTNNKTSKPVPKKTKTINNGQSSGNSTSDDETGEKPADGPRKPRRAKRTPEQNPTLPKREKRQRKAKLNAGNSRDPSLSDSEDSDDSSGSGTGSEESGGNTSGSKRSSSRLAGSGGPKRGPRRRRKKQQNGKSTDKETNPFPRPPKSQLKKSGEKFIQNGSCFEVASALPKCRECRWTQGQRNKKKANMFCRFFGFRLLKYKPSTATTGTNSYKLVVEGFCDPIKDPKEEDLSCWRTATADWTESETERIMRHLAPQFERLIESEKTAKAMMTPGSESRLIWKQAMSGVQDMCDICDTVFFNTHWECANCGFMVCAVCYDKRKKGEKQ